LLGLDSDENQSVVIKKIKVKNISSTDIHIIAVQLYSQANFKLQQYQN